MTTIDFANWYIEGVGGIENIPKDIIINYLD
jgi:hypothetical protein